MNKNQCSRISHEQVGEAYHELQVEIVLNTVRGIVIDFPSNNPCDQVFAENVMNIFPALYR